VTEFELTLPALSALFQVILIDVALSGDNAIVIALAASGLPAEQRKKAIAIGIGAAIALRVLFAISAVYLLELCGWSHARLGLREDVARAAR
jgi:predicted tellurium resistance membrane protein TerC